jgi:hypothetical protein
VWISVRSRWHVRRLRNDSWFSHKKIWNQCSSVGVEKRLELDDRGIDVQFSTVTRNFSLHHCVQNTAVTWQWVCMSQYCACFLDITCLT